MDVFVLNTAVIDLRADAFEFVNSLVGPGGIKKCDIEKMPPYTQEDIKKWIDDDKATAGGPGNSAPLVARLGLHVGVGAMLGAGSFGGFDIQGRSFYDILSSNGVDMSSIITHPTLPTGTTYIYESTDAERGGIAYFPNANDAFDFELFKREVSLHHPRIVYYMYSGLSENGDANEGKDLADFIGWCRDQGCITIADSHTLCADPQSIINSGQSVEEYRLLVPLLDEVDIFFTSTDEARMIGNTIDGPSKWSHGSDEELIPGFLSYLHRRFAQQNERTRLFGVTVSTGAYARLVAQDRTTTSQLFESRFTTGEVVDLVGAGDSFRAGLISYVARNVESFRDGTINIGEAVQLGNLVASLFIKAPLNDRYSDILSYEQLLARVRGSIEE